MIGEADLQARTREARRYFTGTGGTYDRVARLCTLGADLWWKRLILDQVPRDAVRILDQACGTGILTLALSRRFPTAQVVGVDMQDGYLEVAREKLRQQGLGNVTLMLGLAEEVSLPGPWDCITSSYLAKYADLDRLVANAGRMLRPGGRLIMHDFTYPHSQLPARAWELHFRLLQKAGARLFPAWDDVFKKLPAFLRETRWVEELTAALGREGFTGIRVRRLTFGSAALVTASATRLRPAGTPE